MVSFSITALFYRDSLETSRFEKGGVWKDDFNNSLILTGYGHVLFISSSFVFILFISHYLEKT